MLRIHVSKEKEAMTLRLEGSLGGAWVAELEKCWQAMTASPPRAAIVVKLAGLTFVDDRGKELLFRMRQEGARLVPSGCLMRAIVETIESKICRQKGEVV
jgi:hypothetical protein